MDCEQFHLLHIGEAGEGFRKQIPDFIQSNELQQARAGAAQTAELPTYF